MTFFNDQQKEAAARKRKHKGLILFACYDEEKADEVYVLLRKLIETCTATNWYLVRIDNNQEDLPWSEVQKRPFREYSLGGDNLFHEFSAWDKGWNEASKRLGDEFDLIIIVNDALKNSKPYEQLSFMNNTMVRYLANWDAAVGWVDTFSRVSPDPIDAIARPMRIFENKSRCYVTTTFIAFSRRVFLDVVPLLRVTDVDSMYYPRYEGRAFRPNCGLGVEYQNFLLAHQSRKWYRRYELDADTYDLFKRKTLMIINEGYLGCRIIATKAKLINFYELARKSKWKAKTLKRLEPFDQRRFLFMSLMSDLYSWREIKRSSIAFYRKKLDMDWAKPD